MQKAISGKGVGEMPADRKQKMDEAMRQHGMGGVGTSAPSGQPVTR